MRTYILRRHVTWSGKNNQILLTYSKSSDILHQIYKSMYYKQTQMHLMQQQLSIPDKCAAYVPLCQPIFYKDNSIVMDNFKRR